MCIHRVAACALAFWAGWPAMAQPKDDPPVAQSSVGLVIEVIAQPRQVELPGVFRLAFKVQNSTAETAVLQKFELQSVEAPTQLEVSGTCSSGAAQQGIAPREYTTIVCEITTPQHSDTFGGFFAPMLTRWSLLTLSPGDYQFIVAAAARGENSSGEPVALTQSKTVSVKLSPAVWQSVFGAMLGSWLMVVFWLSSAQVQTKVGVVAAGRDSLQNILTTAGRAAVLWCGSTTAAAIAIFMTFRLKDASLPFTVSVNDFYGGLVVGLFGVVLTKWLGSKLFG